jgi:PIN domain nuclease of toxin-antitoxin system
MIRVLGGEDSPVLLSTVSILEIAIKGCIGKLDFPDEVLVRAIDDLELAEGIPMLTTNAVFCEYKPFGFELVQA